MARADNVFVGGALTQLILTPRGPNSCAKYRTDASNEAFAQPIAPYPGTAKFEPMYDRVVMEGDVVVIGIFAVGLVVVAVVAVLEVSKGRA